MLTSLSHPLVKGLVRLRKEKSAREEAGRVVLCGYKLIRDVCQSIRPERLLLPSELPPPVEADEIIRVSPQILAKIAGRSAERDAVAEVLLPPPMPLRAFDRLLILDGIGDPGNMGTLLRTALAFGWDELLLLPGCADPFNDKALRAAQGAIFALRYRWGSIDDLPPETTLLVADATGEPIDTVVGSITLALGSEGQGPSRAVLRRGRKVGIPTATESINVAVAGGILMCRFRP